MKQDQFSGSFYGPPSLVAMLKHRARHQPESRAFTFLVDGESEELNLTYFELDRRARAIAAWLESHDLSGQRALLLFPPGLDFITAFFGCLYAGVVAVTAYPPRANRSIERIRAIVGDSGAKAALSTSTIWGRIRPLVEKAADLQQLDWLHTDQVSDRLADEWRGSQVEADSLAFLQYTSGSTGTPKGVMMTHGNLLHNSALICHAFEHTRSVSGVFWLPSYHDMGLVGGILQPVYTGRPNVLMSPMAFLQKPYRWLRAITQYHGTTSGGPNFAYQLCIDRISPEQCAKLDLSSWQVAFNGAEPIRAETLERFVEKFGPCGFRREAFYPCYGLAEATLIVTGGYVKQPPRIASVDGEALEHHRAERASDESQTVRRLIGCGGSLPDQSVVIADPETARTLPDAQIGEIWVKGPSVASGYWQREEESAQTFGARLSDTGDGPFLRTGDLGFLHDGELFVTGRIKDLIILRGVNHYPQDIELTVEKSHPALRCGFGAAFTVERDGESRLVVVQEIDRGQRNLADEAIQAICRDVAREHELRVDAVVLIKPGRIARTSSGKIQRHACRDDYLAGNLRKVAAWDAETGLTAAVRGSAKQEVAATPPTNGSSTRWDPPMIPASRPPVGLPQLESDGCNGTPTINGNSLEDRFTIRLASFENPLDEVFNAVRDLVPERARNLSAESSMADLGLDSLQRIELQTMLEDRLGGRIPEDVAVGIETLGQIADAVKAYLGTSATESTRSLNDISPADCDFAQYPEYVQLRERMELVSAAGIRNPFFSEHADVAGDTTMVDGERLINFSNYNYIGMSGDPVVSRAAKEAIDRYGTSVSASRLVSGQKSIHSQLEQAIADLVGTDSAIVYVGGHATNETTIGHLFGPGDLILHDALAHNSIVQGCMLSGAARRPFPHNDWQSLDRMLRDLRPRYRRTLVAIESVYSMDGDIADLPKFIEVKKRHKAFLFVDEAHSIGILGRHGRGIGEWFGVHPRDVDLWMGTLSKSLGSCGGYIAGSQAVVEYLKYTAPGFVFSCGITPANAAAALAAIRLLETEPQRVTRLQANAALFLELARRRRLNVGMSKDTPIIPVILGNSLHALQLSEGLRAKGINVQPIMYPAVEESKARLRFFLSSLHTEEQIRYTVDAVAEELSRIDPHYTGAPAASAMVVSNSLSATSKSS